MRNLSVVVIMAKQPQVGHSKTRLCPPLTLEEAARLYEALLRDTIELTASIPGADLAVAITPPDSQTYFEVLTPPGTLLLPVEGANIGICLSAALERLLATGYHKAIALNSDGPSLPLDYLNQAVQALDENDVVLGPSEDGGYYLVGLNKICVELFQGIRWSTAEVLAQTCQRVAQLNLQLAMTPSWYDVDTATDLLRLKNELGLLPNTALTYTRQFMTGFDPHRLNTPGIQGK